MLADPVPLGDGRQRVATGVGSHGSLKLRSSQEDPRSDPVPLEDGADSVPLYPVELGQLSPLGTCGVLRDEVPLAFGR